MRPRPTGAPNDEEEQQQQPQQPRSSSSSSSLSCSFPLLSEKNGYRSCRVCVRDTSPRVSAAASSNDGDDVRSCLFVRLPVATLTALLRDFANHSKTTTKTTHRHHFQAGGGGGWSLEEEHVAAAVWESSKHHTTHGNDDVKRPEPLVVVDFLPLELVVDWQPDEQRRRRRQVVLYASFNGGILPQPSNHQNNNRTHHGGDDDGGEVDDENDQNDGWIEIPSSLLLQPISDDDDNYDDDDDDDRESKTRIIHSRPLLLWKDDDDKVPPLVARVRIVPWILDATKVLLQPLTAHDSMLWHAQADWLEQGGLLQQVSLVYKGQVLEIAVPDSQGHYDHHQYHHSSTTMTTTTVQQTQRLARARVIQLWPPSYQNPDRNRNTMKQQRDKTRTRRLGKKCCCGMDNVDQDDDDIDIDNSFDSVNELEWPDDDEYDTEAWADMNGDAVDQDNEEAKDHDSKAMEEPVTTTHSDLVPPPCRRLLANARIVIVDPPPRCDEAGRALVGLQPCPTWDDYSPCLPKLAQRLHPHVSVPPQVPTPNTVLVHPSTARAIWARANWKRPPTKSVAISRTIKNNNVDVDDGSIKDDNDDPLCRLASVQNEDNECDPYSCLVQITRLVDVQRTTTKHDEMEEAHLERQDTVRATTRTTSSSSPLGPKNALVPSLVARVEISNDVPSPRHIALHPLQCQSLQLDPSRNSPENQVCLEPLTPWEEEDFSSRVVDSVEQGRARLQLVPAQMTRPFLGMSHFMASSVTCSSNWASCRTLPFPKNDPVTLGSLVTWGGGVYQLDYVIDAVWDESPQEVFGSCKIPFLFAKDLTDLQQLDSLVQMKTSSPENIISLVSPTESPRMLNLLPEPTLIPSQMKFWSNSDHGLPHCLRDCNLLLHGSSGSGKTRSALLVAALARLQFQAGCVYFDCRSEKDAATQLDQLLGALTDLIENALQSCGPCLVILDDLDEICPNLLLLQGASTGTSGTSSSSQAMEQTSPAEMEQVKIVRDHLNSLLSASDNLAVLATCRDANAVARTLSRHHHLHQSIAMPILTGEDRTGLFQSLLCHGLEINSIATDGSLSLEFRLRDLLPRDIEMLASRILKHDVLRSQDNLSSFVMKEVDAYVPLSRRSASEEPREFFPNWQHDIGGLFDAKKTLVDLVVRPMKFRRIYETSRIRLPKGILLFGPPGCGKTILPASLAREVGLPLIVCRGPEILDKYMGASEAKVRALFERANLSAPSILFFDEIDSLAPHRGSDLTGVTDRVVNQLLTFLDGVEDASAGKSVYVIASSSRPDKIDSALLRPGRLEKHVYVGPPSSRRELEDVWIKIAFKYIIDPALKNELRSGRFLNGMLNGDKPQFMAPSDVKAVFDTAQIKVVREHLNLQCSRHEDDTSRGETTSVITMNNLQDALRCTQTGLGATERQRLEKIYDRFRNERTPRQENVMDSVQRVALK
ncbi:hypothetical protein ACA910_013675 [Epithemia clementina (nom. ined.)]